MDISTVKPSWPTQSNLAIQNWKKHFRQSSQCEFQFQCYDFESIFWGKCVAYSTMFYPRAPYVANHVGNRFLGAGQAYAGPSVVGYPIGNGFAKDFKKNALGKSKL